MLRWWRTRKMRWAVREHRRIHGLMKTSRRLGGAWNSKTIIPLRKRLSVREIDLLSRHIAYGIGWGTELVRSVDGGTIWEIQREVRPC